MSNCIFGFPIYSDVGVSFTPALSGGDWESDLPLTNVQDRRTAKVARSADATEAATTFDVDLGTTRSVRVIAILLPNITTSATIRARASTVSDFASTVYDSGVVAAWPSGIDAEESEGMNVWTTLVLSSAQNARYVRINIADTGNADGYVDVARLIVAGGWQPSVNFDQGFRLGVTSASESKETDGAAMVHDERPRRRTVAGVHSFLAESEAMANGFDMQRIVGTTRQVYFVYDPDDTTHMHRRAFPGVFRELSPMEHTVYSRWGFPFQIVEEL